MKYAGSYSEPCGFLKIDQTSLLVEGYLRKFIWREARNEQTTRKHVVKGSLEEAILRMGALNSEKIFTIKKGFCKKVQNIKSRDQCCEQELL